MKRRLYGVKIQVQEWLGILMPRESRMRLLRYNLKEARASLAFSARILAIDSNDPNIRAWAYSHLKYSHSCLEDALELAKTLYY